MVWLRNPTRFQQFCCWSPSVNLVPNLKLHRDTVRTELCFVNIPSRGCWGSSWPSRPHTWKAKYVMMLAKTNTERIIHTPLKLLLDDNCLSTVWRRSHSCSEFTGLSLTHESHFWHPIIASHLFCISAGKEYVWEVREQQLLPQKEFFQFSITLILTGRNSTLRCFPKSRTITYTFMCYCNATVFIV